MSEFQTRCRGHRRTLYKRAVARRGDQATSCTRTRNPHNLTARLKLQGEKSASDKKIGKTFFLFLFPFPFRFLLPSLSGGARGPCAPSRRKLRRVELTLITDVTRSFTSQATPPRHLPTFPPSRTTTRPTTMSLQRALPRAARCLRQRLPAASPVPVAVPVAVPVQRRFMSSSPQGGGIPVPYITEVTVRPCPRNVVARAVLLLTGSSPAAGGHVRALPPPPTGRLVLTLRSRHLFQATTGMAARCTLLGGRGQGN